MKKVFSIYSLVLLSTAALANEPSVFGTTTIDNTPTYTPTYTEPKKSNTTNYNSQKVVTVNDNPSSSSSSRHDSSSANAEQYDMLRSVMESYEAKISKQDEKMRRMEEENKKLREYVEESRKIQNDNQEKIKAVVGELGNLIDSINKSYVPKEKFDQLANEVRGGKTAASKTQATAPAEPAKKETAVSAKELSGKDSATLLKEADDMYDKNTYGTAKPYYQELLHRNYKPAKVNYSLGEIAFNEKSYSAAIEHYKASIALSDKGPYTPSLLLHTAQSFEKLNKTKEAQAFYKALKDNYPNSPEAKKVK